MHRPDSRTLRIVALVASGLALHAALVFGQDGPSESLPGDVPSLAAREGVLLLRNGSVVSGRILNSGEVYQVERPAGRMSVPAVLVKCEARTLTELHAKLREGVKARASAEAHMSLARWCITNHLLAEARRELEDALVLEPEYGAARDMLRRVERLQAENPGFDAAQVRRPTSPVTPANYSREDAESLSGLDAESVREFSRRIQPILMNNCAAAGCHHAVSQTGFRLQRVLSGATAGRNATERNVAEVLDQIDIEAPDRSALVVMAQKRHGPSSRHPFSGPYGQKQFAELRAWVERAVELQTARGKSTTRGSARRSPVEQAVASDVSENRSTKASRLQQEPVEIGSRGKAPASRPAQRIAGDDPFDPGEFNRARGGSP